MTHETRDVGEPCAEFLGLLVRAADDELGEEPRARLEAHLATCAACAEALETQRQARVAVAGWVPASVVSPGFAGRVMDAIDDERRGTVWSTPDPGAIDWLALLDFRRWTWRLAPLAAALSLVAGLVVSQSSEALAEESLDVTAAVPASSAIWSESVSESELLSLWLTTDADAPLADALEEVQP